MAYLSPRLGIQLCVQERATKPDEGTVEDPIARRNEAVYGQEKRQGQAERALCLGHDVSWP